MEEPHSNSLLDDSEDPPQGCSSIQFLDLESEYRSRSFAEADGKGVSTIIGRRAALAGWQASCRPIRGISARSPLSLVREEG